MAAVTPSIMTRALPWIRRHPVLFLIALAIFLVFTEIASDVEFSGRLGVIQNTLWCAVGAIIVIYQLRAEGVAFGKSGWTAKADAPLTYWLVIGGEMLFLVIFAWSSLGDALHLKL